MKKIYEESHSDFNIIFGGENEIEASVLVGTMSEVIESLELIKCKVEPEASIKIKVSSFETGSFIVKLKAIIENFSGLLSMDSIGTAANIITILIGAIEIKKHLKGEKPQEVNYIGDDAVIINGDNETLTKNKIVADTYFQDNRIDKSITNIVNIVHVDGGRENLVIQKSDKNIIEIKKDDFEKMSKQVITEEDIIVKTMKNVVEVDLLLKKPDLLGRSKWGFVFDKNIEATIEDEEWLEKVHSGNIALYAGVKVPVEMLIEIDLDKNNNHIATRYTVLKVTGDVIEPSRNNFEQLKFD